MHRLKRVLAGYCSIRLRSLTCESGAPSRLQIQGRLEAWGKVGTCVSIGSTAATQYLGRDSFRMRRVVKGYEALCAIMPRCQALFDVLFSLLPDETDFQATSGLWRCTSADVRGRNVWALFIEPLDCGIQHSGSRQRRERAGSVQRAGDIQAAGSGVEGHPVARQGSGETPIRMGRFRAAGALR